MVLFVNVVDAQTYTPQPSPYYHPDDTCPDMILSGMDLHPDWLSQCSYCLHGQPQLTPLPTATDNAFKIDVPTPIVTSTPSPTVINNPTITPTPSPTFTPTSTPDANPNDYDWCFEFDFRWDRYEDVFPSDDQFGDFTTWDYGLGITGGAQQSNRPFIYHNFLDNIGDALWVDLREFEVGMLTYNSDTRLGVYYNNARHSSDHVTSLYYGDSDWLVQPGQSGVSVWQYALWSGYPPVQTSPFYIQDLRLAGNGVCPDSLPAGNLCPGYDDTTCGSVVNTPTPTFTPTPTREFIKVYQDVETLEPHYAPDWYGIESYPGYQYAMMCDASGLDCGWAWVWDYIRDYTSQNYLCPSGSLCEYIQSISLDVEVHDYTRQLDILLAGNNEIAQSVSIEVFASTFENDNPDLVGSKVIESSPGIPWGWHTIFLDSSLDGGYFPVYADFLTLQIQSGIDGQNPDVAQLAIDEVHIRPVHSPVEATSTPIPSDYCKTPILIDTSGGGGDGGLGFEYVSTSCYTLMHEATMDVSGLWSGGQDIGIPGLEVCVDWYEMNTINILGVVFSLVDIISLAALLGFASMVMKGN